MDYSDICRFCERPLREHEECCVGGIITPENRDWTHPHWRCSQSGMLGWLSRAEIAKPLDNRRIPLSVRKRARQNIDEWQTNPQKATK